MLYAVSVLRRGLIAGVLTAASEESDPRILFASDGFLCDRS
jgi:hypothetical protein